jgi:hypothetical protein
LAGKKVPEKIKNFHFSRGIVFEFIFWEFGDLLMLNDCVEIGLV